MKESTNILEQAQHYFGKGLGFTNQVLENSFVQRLRAFLPKPVKMVIAMKNIYDKNDLDSNLQSIAEDLFQKTQSLGAFIKAYYKGEYRDIDTLKIFLILASLVYVSSPVDLIPNWIKFLGFFDEIVLTAWLFQSLHEELGKFEAWKLDNPDVEVVA